MDPKNSVWSAVMKAVENWDVSKKEEIAWVTMMSISHQRKIVHRSIEKNLRVFVGLSNPFHNKLFHYFLYNVIVPMMGTDSTIKYNAIKSRYDLCKNYRDNYNWNSKRRRLIMEIPETLYQKISDKYGFDYIVNEDTELALNEYGEIIPFSLVRLWCWGIPGFDNCNMINQIEVFTETPFNKRVYNPDKYNQYDYLIEQIFPVGKGKNKSIGYYYPLSEERLKKLEEQFNKLNLPFESILFNP